jgi:hypothetical protein
LETDQALLEEALAPLRDDLTGQMEPFTNLFVGKTISSEEDNLGTHDVAIR